MALRSYQIGKMLTGSTVPILLQCDEALVPLPSAAYDDVT